MIRGVDRPAELEPAPEPGLQPSLQCRSCSCTGPASGYDRIRSNGLCRACDARVRRDNKAAKKSADALLRRSKPPPSPPPLPREDQPAALPLASPWIEQPATAPPRVLETSLKLCNSVRSDLPPDASIELYQPLAFAMGRYRARDCPIVLAAGSIGDACSKCTSKRSNFARDARRLGLTSAKAADEDDTNAWVLTKISALLPALRTGPLNDMQHAKMLQFARIVDARQLPLNDDGVVDRKKSSSARASRSTTSA
ncbi:LOW QUALITY PROTEIN: hypothetical protein SPRG_16803 [Saprolegnia parasitica CBS 223.65]|uniref:Uncharacterized protein n=1 Tax=Saprolegnia parasitica (strain CBS 223.65) TaxID=695850 RepID=A0A067BU09_SAPPC|nr:LOW QUALITY PROTEIN: hypothetical protein SPRG_16803 [Saprolegnia parasitica CBS 223.65]KDO17761.1 LOW QUALITY PROTEIN: hypothetical protein SPRG_16803 [Saprolegnia parasitica CBS 223.65]|eukprot:XP_012211533.1 LOW QUALITY PROTEIN: hypothetical protein SPRG_16803 [Saprolegnia parasitica CBS 223.65]